MMLDVGPSEGMGCKKVDCILARLSLHDTDPNSKVGKQKVALLGVCSS
jgi:hypothetical protein